VPVISRFIYRNSIQVSKYGSFPLVTLSSYMYTEPTVVRHRYIMTLSGVYKEFCFGGEGGFNKFS